MKFTEEHEWIRLEADGTATVGITEYAQEQLGDVVYVELPAVGKEVKKGGEAAVVESVKAASEIFSPADGKVISVNGKLTGEPALVNTAPFGEGWFFKLQLADKGQLAPLMDEAAYKKFCEGLG